MNDLADYLSFVVSTLQASTICQDIRVAETQVFSGSQFLLKARAVLKDDSVLQVRLYINKPHIDYAYQVVRNEEPIIRWDNKEHFPTIASFPHHFHGLDYKVTASPLNGNPEQDLPLVLDILSKLL